MKPHFRKAFSLIELLFVIAIISLLAALLFPVFARAREQARGAVCLSNLRQIGTGIQLYLQDYDEAFPMNRLPDETHLMEGCKSAGNSYPIGNLEESRFDWRRSVLPYLKSKPVMLCPSNPYTEKSPAPNIPPGDQTNSHYAPKDYIPLSYAYNGSFFHEAVPPCFYGEPLERPRVLSEIDRVGDLIMLLESRLPNPDLGSWMMRMQADLGGLGSFQSHNKQCNFLFTDMHARRLKLAATCSLKMWSDRYPDGPDACTHLDELLEEYR